ncbi:helix-turn-helix domain-containing protein [Brenneria populi Li et al. 2015]|uniref:Helix-turn-helix domain-containing protein n=1 Tax=Brenneria populi TaxID=1505588 RepID=A0ABU6JS71_9GAMM|nr:helix-turn-helix domain-containing protein [Brenneria populi Li et al. 2015]
MDIAQVARASGLTPATLRFYESKGLISPTGRHGLRRQYPAGVLQQLALIALGKRAGFSLKEIAGMFDPTGKPLPDRDRLAEKAREINDTIQRLAAVRDGLQHAADCPYANHLECPSFQKMLKAATRSERRRVTPR